MRTGALVALLALVSLATSGPVLAPGPRGPRAAPQAADPEADAEDWRADYLAFAELLVRFRQGEDEVLEPLRAAGRRFSERHGRADAPQVVEAYARLSRAERIQGWNDYLRFADLWSRVAEADAEAWRAERGALVAELRALAAEGLARADRGPAGRALSLCARIAVHALEHDPPGSAADRRALAARARADAERALEVFEAAGQRTPRLEPLWLLGTLERLDGRPDLAEERLARVLDEARALRAEDYRQHALLGLVHLARVRGDAPRVDRLLDELATFRDPRTCWPLAREHALRLLDEDAPDAALELLARVEPEAPAARGVWRELCAFALLRAGDLEAAEAALDGQGDDLARWTLEVRAGRGAARLPELARAADDDRRELRDRLVAGALAGEALLQADRPGEALAALTAAIELAARYEARLDELELLDGGGASVVGERLGLHTIALAARASCALGRELEAAALVEAHQSRALRAPRVDAEVVRAWAARYEHGLVTFVCGADLALAIHVAPDGRAEARAIPRGRRALADAVRRLREAAIDGDAPRLARLGEELSRALLPSGLRARLAAGPADGRVLFLLHGPLERLPVEALALDGRLLDARCAPLALPGLPETAPGPPLEPEALVGWRALGDPLDARGRALLPAARAELEAVARAHAGTRLAAGSDFDRAALVEALGSGAPLHVATHVLRSELCRGARLAPFALELSGGDLLCAEEVAAAAPRAPLVVLSACATAEGRYLDAEGLQGLARVFLESGTRNLLVTLWPVEDGAARRAGERYHAALRDGLGPARAARAARAALREAGFPPADWAAFRALGRD